MTSILRKFKHKEDTKNIDTTNFMMRNGATVLKELIASSNGKYNPYRIFSAQEIKLATNYYDSEKVIIQSSIYKLYKGFWQYRFILVMKFENMGLGYTCSINNIVYASQMIHKHILQLIGCCLETEIPILVFESVEYGTLGDLIYGNTQFEPLPLKQRLKIAMDIANALAYIHLGFPRPIVFRNLKMSSILLDEQNTVKLFDFSFSITIPEGETHVTDEVVGTYFYIAPEYMRTGDFNEESDVYGFGVFLFELFTRQRIHVFDFSFGRHDEYDDDISLPDEDDGDFNLQCDISLQNHVCDSSFQALVKEYFEENRDNEILDPLIAEDRSSPNNSIERQVFERLIFECVNDSPADRPPMIDVAKRLRQIYRSCSCT